MGAPDAVLAELCAQREHQVPQRRAHAGDWLGRGPDQQACYRLQAWGWHGTRATTTAERAGKKSGWWCLPRNGHAGGEHGGGSPTRKSPADPGHARAGSTAAPIWWMWRWLARQI